MLLEQKIAAIEKFPLWLNTKVELLLVMADEKHAIEIHLFSKPSPISAGPPTPVSQRRSSALRNLLTKIEVPFTMVGPDVMKEEEDGTVYERLLICVGANQEYLDQMTEVWTKLDANGYPGSDELHGRLSGFPESAVKAFISNQLMPFDEQEKLCKELPYAHFVQMRLSQDNWKEELKTPERWAKKVREMSPAIYAKFVNIRYK